jgi:hypothetical protein
VDELPVVGALRTLCIFDADQEAAYREHFAAAAAVLGDDVPMRLAERAAEWARRGEAGLWILTGNAGTGKTAVAEGFCRECGGQLPDDDELREVAPGRWAAKDLSGLADGAARAARVAKAIELAGAGAQVLLCANEGILRDAAESLGEADAGLGALLDRALRDGAAEQDGTLIVNVNRQRPTAERLWGDLLDYLTREELWEQGCDGCPLDGAGCPMRENARALRDPEVREGMRSLVRLGSGDAVPTLREVLAILGWALVGDWTCEQARERARDQARSAFTAEDAYYARFLGHGLALEAVERSPLLSGMRESGLGDVADLQVDEWLRDTTNAPREVQELAGAPDGFADPQQARDPLAGTRSPHDRVATTVGTMTFHSLGETVATSEDLSRVDAGLDALVNGGGMPRQALWRRRVYFERPDALGGRAAAGSRLLASRYLHELLELAEKTAGERDTTLELTEIVQGLNFLVCGFGSPNEGLIVPDQACLFARDPGSFRPARPSLVQAQIPLEQLKLRAPDRGLVRELLDVDFVEVDLVVAGESEHALRLRPRLYEAVRQGAAYRGPVGQGIAEMADVRGFYGALAGTPAAGRALRVADPNADPPALITVRMPHLQADA